MNTPIQQPVRVSIAADAASFERFADSVQRVLTGLFDDLVPVFLEDARMQLASRFNQPVDGTEQLVVICEFDPVPLDLKIRAALRAGGLDLDLAGIRHNERSLGSLTVPMVHDGEGVPPAPSPDAPEPPLARSAPRQAHPRQRQTAGFLDVSSQTSAGADVGAGSFGERRPWTY